MSAEPAHIDIRDESIRLGQLLKPAGFVDDGATAREVIKAGAVTVNEEIDTRHGRQVRPGDLVAFAGQRVRMTARPYALETVSETASTAPPTRRRLTFASVMAVWSSTADAGPPISVAQRSSGCVLSSGI